MRRRWRSFVAADFEAGLSSSRLCTGLDNLDHLSADELMEMYDSEMLLLLDKHCPRVAVKQKQCRLTPWFDAECRKSRCHVRVLERRYRRSCKKADKSACCQRWSPCMPCMRRKPASTDSKGDSRRLWRTMSGIIIIIYYFIIIIYLLRQMAAQYKSI